MPSAARHLASAGWSSEPPCVSGWSQPLRPLTRAGSPACHLASAVGGATSRQPLEYERSRDTLLEGGGHGVPLMQRTFMNANRFLRASLDALASAIPFRDIFSLDIRSLALYRVCLGLLLLLDWIDRLPDLRPLYSDEGIILRNSITGLQPFSLLLLNGSVTYALIFCLVAIGFAGMLMVGYRTVLATIVSWLLLISIHGRTPPVMDGGDHLVRALLFWSIFLPLGATFSVDSLRGDTRPISPSVLSLGSFAYVLQMIQLYWFAAAYKWLGPWREEGTAVYLSLQVDHFVTHFGHWIGSMPDVCRLLTHSTIALETLGPILLLLPFAVGLQRMIAIALFVLFHAGLALAMDLAHFPFVCMVAWLPLLPTTFWNRLQVGLPQVQRGRAVVNWLSARVQQANWLHAISPGASGWQSPTGLLANSLLGFVTLYVLVGNILPYVSSKLEGQQPEVARRVLPLVPVSFFHLALTSGLEQNWSLFAPQPGRYVGWHVLVGVRSDGSQINLYTGQPVNWEKPAYLTSTYANARWRRLIMNLIHPEQYPYLLPGFLRYFYKDYQKRYSDQLLTAVECYWMLEITVPPEQNPAPPTKVLLGRYIPQEYLDTQTPEWLAVVGTRTDGRLINLLRYGWPVDWNRAPPAEERGTTSTWQPVIQRLADSKADYLLQPLARHLLEAWNKEHEPPEQVRQVDIVRVRSRALATGGSVSESEREVLGRYLLDKGN
jgi:hypothetical protein